MWSRTHGVQSDRCPGAGEGEHRGGIETRLCVCFCICEFGVSNSSRSYNMYCTEHYDFRSVNFIQMQNQKRNINEAFLFYFIL